MGKATVTLREKLVSNILYYSGDEFETRDDVVTLATETEEQLIDRLIGILDYYYSEYEETENSVS
jgi:hypothetical protein